MKWEGGKKIRFWEKPRAKTKESSKSFESFVPTAQKSYMQPGLPEGQGPEDLDRATRRRGRWHWSPTGDDNNHDNNKHRELSHVGVLYSFAGVISAVITTPFSGKIIYPFLIGASASRFGDSQKLEYDRSGIMHRFYNGVPYIMGVGWTVGFVLSGNPILFTLAASFWAGFIFGKITRKNLW